MTNKFKELSVWEVANDYYSFCHPGFSLVREKFIKVILALGSLAAFLSSLVFLLPYVSAPIYLSWRFGAVLGLEIITLFGFLYVHSAAQSFILNRAKTELGEQFDDLVDAKSAWLQAKLMLTSGDFLKVSRDLKEIIATRRLYTRNLEYTGEQMRSWFVEAGSKDRLVVVFMGCIAAMVAFIIAGGANLADLVGALKQFAHIQTWLSLVALCSGLLLAIVLVRLTWDAGIIFFDWFLGLFQRRNVRNTRSMELLIRDLVDLHCLRAWSRQGH